MEFRIADTFTDSLARLAGDEQKAVKTTAFDLQLNPAHPSLQFHKLDRARDRRFWSIRVTGDIRVILHRNESSLLLCYAGHHDDAYRWAAQRKLETHPKTGAAQIVEVRETVQEIAVPKYVGVAEPAPRKPPLLAGISEEQLLGYGVPAEWLADVRGADEDTLLELAGRLPGEAAEALLDLATGVTPQAARPAASGADPFAHPDAQRRFRVVANVAELERALDYPWEKWAVFLHPAQRALVEKDYNGPARVAGSAGTGKTIVALHRAVFLTRANPDARVLLTTFSDALSNALRTKLRGLIGNEPRLAERLEVHSMFAIGRRLYEANFGRPKIVGRQTMRELLKEASEAMPEGDRFSMPFLVSEWDQVADAWQLDSWEAYRDVARLGRKTRLPEAKRAAVWRVFERARSGLHERGLVTWPEVFSRVTAKLRDSSRPPFDFAVIDEAQDIGVQQLRFLAALKHAAPGAAQPNSLFFAGDLGQRIFQQPFSWKALGVDIRGRSSTLRINYRTSHQIRKQADRLLGPEVSDVDGNTEDRRGTISTFNGPPPEILVLPAREEEVRTVGRWLSDRGKEGMAPREIGIFVRSADQLDRARAAVEDAKLPYRILDDSVETAAGHVSIGTMHLGKGLEFRTVVVMACDDEVIPLQERIETVADGADLDEVYNTERHLLYVACTRARDRLLVTGAGPASEFFGRPPVIDTHPLTGTSSQGTNREMWPSVRDFPGFLSVFIRVHPRLNQQFLYHDDPSRRLGSAVKEAPPLTGRPELRWPGQISNP